MTSPVVETDFPARAVRDPQLGRDERLQRIRRIDARFLTSSAVWGDVAYVGARCSELMEALKLVSDTLRWFPQAKDVEGSFDTIVLRASSRETASALSRHVNSPGALLWEALEGTPGSSRALETGLRRSGFSSANCFWNRPTFEECQELVPMSASRVLSRVLSRKLPWLASAAGEFALSVADDLSLLNRALAHRTVVATKGSADDLVVACARRYGLESGIDVETPVRCLVKTPRFRASSHVLFFLHPLGEAEPCVVAKVARLSGETEFLEREAEQLRALQECTEAEPLNVPRLITMEETGGAHLLLETVVSGMPMTPQDVRSDFERCKRLGVAWLEELDRKTKTQDGPAADSRDLSGDLAECEAVFHGDAATEAALEATRSAAERLGNQGIGRVFEHGDFSAPNLLISAEGELGVVDWELARADGLPGADLVFFLTFLAVARDQARTHDECVAAYERAFLHRDGWALGVLSRFLEERALPKEAARDLLAVTWARYVGRLAQRLGLDEGRAEEGTLTWLHQNRYWTMWNRTVASDMAEEARS